MGGGSSLLPLQCPTITTTKGTQALKSDKPSSDADSHSHPELDLAEQPGGSSLSRGAVVIKSPGLTARVKVRVNKESPEIGWKRFTLLWALAMLTILLLVPLFVPSLAFYVVPISVPLLTVTCAIIGVDYRRQATATPGVKD